MGGLASLPLYRPEHLPGGDTEDVEAVRGYAAEEGYQATAANYGYAIRVCVADSEAEAYELGRNFYWQLGRTFGRVPLHWQRPPGS